MTASDVVVERYECRRCADPVDALARNGPPRYRRCRGRTRDQDPAFVTPRAARLYCDFERMPPPTRAPSRVGTHVLLLDPLGEPIVATCSCDAWRRILGRDELTLRQLDSLEIVQAFLEGLHAMHAHEREHLRTTLTEDYYSQ